MNARLVKQLNVNNVTHHFNKVKKKSLNFKKWIKPKVCY